jgi:hypothetical protein
MTITSPLAKKLQIKPGDAVVVRGATKDALALLEPLPEGAKISTRGSGPADVTILFVRTSVDVMRVANEVERAAAAGIVWLAYPKGTSGITTDLNRDAGWDAITKRGFIGVAIVAVDEQWSASRMRPGTPAEQKKASSLAAGMRAPKAKAAKVKPPAKTPADLNAALTASAAAKETFGSLAPSHHREYVAWIEEAKKPETRARRVADAVKMLEAGVRDRNARYR